MRSKEQGFDWSNKTIVHDSDSYSPMIGYELMTVLVLPSIDYFIPVLAKVGFPDYLVQRPEIWKSLFTEFAVYYEESKNNFMEWEENEFTPARTQALKLYQSNGNPSRGETIDFLSKFDREHKFSYFYLYLKMWKVFLERLREKTNESVAILLERWIYRHHLSFRYQEAMHGWWCLIVNSQETSEFPVPEFFLPVYKEISEYVNYNDLYIFNKDIDILYYEKYNEECKAGLHLPYLADHQTLKNAFKNDRVTQMLHAFAVSLDADQIRSVVDWAENFSRKSIISNPGRLCGSELIITEIPFSDCPSILQIEDLKQSIKFLESRGTRVLSLSQQ